MAKRIRAHVKVHLNGMHFPAHAHGTSVDFKAEADDMDSNRFFDQVSGSVAFLLSEIHGGGGDDGGDGEDEPEPDPVVPDHVPEDMTL